jgi:hypothetical protein
MDTANTPEWSYEYLPYTVTDADGTESELPNYRIFPDDSPELYIAETNEHLPGDLQEDHARLITAAPLMQDSLLDIKRLAEKSGDHYTDPFALLDLIAEYARAAILKAAGRAYA